jgi:hypothetical protein
LLILILDLHIQFVVEQVLQDLIIVGACFLLDRKPARMRLRCCTHWHNAA